MSNASRSLELETRSIDFIPEPERRGKPSSLLFLWFAANAELPVVAVGTIAISQGFSLIWACVALVIGCLIGALFMAYHSAQGPHLGIPQMIQSRAQFGFIGAAFPLLIVVAMYLGYFAPGGVMGGEAVSELLHVPETLGIIIVCILCFFLALFGYDLIHRVERYLGIFIFAAFLVFTIVLVADYVHSGQGVSVARGHFELGPFLLALMFSATTQLAYAPYVADYSRYLPKTTSIRSTFWFTYIGINLSGIWFMILGAVMESRFPIADPVQQMTHISAYLGSWFTYVTLLAIVLGILCINTLDIYGAYMSSFTITTTFAPRVKPTLSKRIWFVLCSSIVCALASFLYKDNLISSYENFLQFLLAFLVPWTAINLTDFYFVRRGKYVVEEIFNPRGIYGRVNWLSMIAYFVGFIVQVPFMDNAIYEGPIAKMLGGGDISWAVGVIVAGGLYLLLMKSKMNKASSNNMNEPVSQMG